VKPDKIVYFLTPPIFYRIFGRVFRNTKSWELGQKTSAMVSRDVLKELRAEKMNYFFKEHVIDEFCDLMEEHFDRNPPIATKNKANQPYLDELAENGFCKIENFFSKEQIQAWHDRVYPAVSAEKETFADLFKKHGRESGKDIGIVKNQIQYQHDLRCGAIRAWDIDVLDASITTSFRDNADIFDICNSYLGGKANETRVYAEFKHELFAKDPNFLLHSDNPFRQIKVFLPLRDIKVENAPFIYHKKTHRVHEWRVLKDLMEFTHYGKKFFTHFASWGDVEMGRFAEQFPELAAYESIVTANAGDVIIADTRGVHGGSILLSDYRLQLGTCYTMLGFDNGHLPSRITKLAKNTQ